MEFNTIISLLGMLILGGVFGLILVFVASKFKVQGNPVVDEINNILPQTQCGQCTYPGCRPYAQAIADGEAPINQCPPGGQETIKQLAELLDLEVLELNPEHGEAKEDTVVEIVEADCIGCTKCIQVCPVDAIIGTAKKMHTVIADECTGCDLCIPACPVDCIVVVKAPMPAYLHRQAQPNLLQSIEQAQQW